MVIFLKMFSFQVIKGNAIDPLRDAGSAMLTELSANKIFGNEDAIGKSIEVKMGGQSCGV